MNTLCKILPLKVDTFFDIFSDINENHISVKQGEKLIPDCLVQVNDSPVVQTTALHKLRITIQDSSCTMQLSKVAPSKQCR